MILYPPSSSVLTADTSGIIKITSLSLTTPSQTTARLEVREPFSGSRECTTVRTKPPNQPKTTPHLFAPLIPQTNVVSACFSAPHLYVYADGVHVHRYTPSPTTNDLGPALLIPVNRGGDTHKSVRILRLEASPDGRYLAGQTDKGKIIIWNIGEGEGGGVTPTPVRELYGHQVRRTM
jgi:hypothetical protein